MKDSEMVSTEYHELETVCEALAKEGFTAQPWQVLKGKQINAHLPQTRGNVESFTKSVVAMENMIAVKRREKALELAVNSSLAGSSKSIMELANTYAEYIESGNIV